MTKVKVSKEVAEDLKWYEINYNNWEETVIIDVIGSKLGLTSGVRAIALDKEFDVMSLVDAVTNGYTIKKSPEENLIDYYMKTLKFHYSDTMSKGQREGILTGIKTTLDLLEIKIDGINQ